MPRPKRLKVVFNLNLRHILRLKATNARTSNNLKVSKIAGKPNRFREVVRATPNALLLTLGLLSDSADACPPLKSVLGALNAIVEQAQVGFYLLALETRHRLYHQAVKGNKREAILVYERVNTLVDVLCNAVSDATNIPTPLMDNIHELKLYVSHQ